MSASQLQPSPPFDLSSELGSFGVSITDVWTDSDRKAQSPFSLQIQLCAIADRIPERPLRAVMLKVFYDFARLMEYLRMIDWESGVRIQHDETVEVLRFVVEESRQLADFMSNRAIDAINSNELFDAFDSAVFAIQHDVVRVLNESFFTATEHEDEVKVQSDLNRARGVLYNCMQQSLVSIAQTLDPFAEGIAMFDDLQLRETQSRILLHDLSNLITLSKQVESDRDFESSMALLESMEQFRSNSMRYLMYKDWGDCTHQLDLIVSAYVIEERAQLLGGFISYLETLLRHVSLRTCLSKGA
jgi:hypothetical protein